MDVQVHSLILNTSLEALIDRATNPHNNALDVAAINAFSGLLSTEPHAVPTAIGLIIPKMQSCNQWEAKQTITLVDMCMETAGPRFRSEVGKFRFLNELIKLISEKHLRHQTAPCIRNQIVLMLEAWSERYPNETKIKEAYEMLKKQGVPMESDCPLDIVEYGVDNGKIAVKNNSPSLLDEEKSKKLKKLLRSKDPLDLQAANKLIKSVVKADEEKMVRESKKVENVKTLQSNVKLLNEMLNNYSNEVTTEQETEIMTELYETCVRLKPELTRIIVSSGDKSVENYAELLELNDDLNSSLRQYDSSFCRRRKTNNSKRTNRTQRASSLSNNSETLLDLGSPLHSASESSRQNGSIKADKTVDDKSKDKAKTDMDALEEIFSSTLDSPLLIDSPKITLKVNSVPLVNTSNTLPILNTGSASAVTVKSSDAPLSTAPKHHKEMFDDLSPLMLSKWVGDTETSKVSGENSVNGSDEKTLHREDSDDDNLSEYGSEGTGSTRSLGDNSASWKLTSPTQKSKLNQVVEPLGDSFIPLVDIVPVADMTVIALDKDGILTKIQLTSNKPREDVFVYLVLTTSTKLQPIKNFSFQPVVPKGCRLKLQPASKRDLPAQNPYIPTETIVQIMHLGTWAKESIRLTFVVSYQIDEEVFTEMGDVDSLPILMPL